MIWLGVFGVQMMNALWKTLPFFLWQQRTLPQIPKIGYHSYRERFPKVIYSSNWVYDLKPDNAGYHWESSRFRWGHSELRRLRNNGDRGITGASSEKTDEFLGKHICSGLKKNQPIKEKTTGTIIKQLPLLDTQRTVYMSKISRYDTLRNYLNRKSKAKF